MCPFSKTRISGVLPWGCQCSSSCFRGGCCEGLGEEFQAMFFKKAAKTFSIFVLLFLLLELCGCNCQMHFMLLPHLHLQKLHFSGSAESGDVCGFSVISKSCCGTCLGWLLLVCSVLKRLWCPTLSLVLSSSNSGVDSVQFCFPLAQSFVLNWGKKFPSCKKGPVSFCFPQTQCRTSWVLEQGTVGYRGSSTAAVEPQTPLCPCWVGQNGFCLFSSQLLWCVYVEGRAHACMEVSQSRLSML